MKKNPELVFIPTVDRSDVMKGDNQSEESMWKGVSGNDSKLSLMARELTQNSIDATNRFVNQKQLTTVRFSLKELDLSFINHQSLIEAINDCIISNEKENTKARLQKFKSALEEDITKVKCLIVEDNSGGLDGDSRFSSTKNGLMAILGENYSDKSSNDLGSFGVGKTTALYISNFGTVFYLNQRSDKKHFIGKTKLSGYLKDGQEGAFFGPNLFCGIETLNGSERVADWAVIDDEFGLRSLEGDGLSTIIPIDLDELSIANLDWKEICAVSCIKSYFKNLEDETLELEFVEGDSIYSINSKNYKSEYEKLSKVITDLDSETMFKHRILISKPYILGETPLVVKTKRVSLKLEKRSTNTEEVYESEIKVSFYENPELEKFLEENHDLSRQETYNFRIIREKILVRNFNFPHYSRTKRLSSNLYCGLVEFSPIEENSKSISELIRITETQSHDSLDLSQLQKTFNKDAQELFDRKIVKVINRLIIDTIDELIGQEKQNLEKIDIVLNIGGDLEGYESGDGYFREIRKINPLPKRNPNLSSIQSNENDSSEDSFESGDIGLGELDAEGGVGNGSNDTDGGISAGNQIGKGGKKEKGSSLIKDKKELLNIKIKTKRIYKKGKKAKYIVSCSNLEQPKEIQLFQNSIEGYRNSIRMFEVTSLKINSKGMESNKLKTNEKSISIPLRSNETGNYLLELEVTEPEHSITDFFIKVI